MDTDPDVEAFIRHAIVNLSKALDLDAKLQWAVLENLSSVLDGYVDAAARAAGMTCETGDPYVPLGYSGPIGRCQLCGNEAPGHPRADGRVLCQPCHDGMNSYPDTIEWADMTSAGIDIDRVKRLPDEDTFTPTWQALSADGARRITFGVCFDVEGVTPEGEHTGWDALTESLSGEEWVATCQEYYEPGDLARLLADVARIAPRGQ